MVYRNLYSHILIVLADAGKGDSDGEDSKQVAEAETEPAEHEEESHEDDSEPKGEGELDGTDDATVTKYSYEQVRAKSENPVMSIDFKKREVGPTINLIKFKHSLFRVSVFSWNQIPVISHIKFDLSKEITRLCT